MKLRNLLVTFSLVFVSCGSTFPYRWYNLAPKSYEGALLGEDEEDDRPLSDCKPTENNKGKCIVMMEPEFRMMRRDRDDLVERLRATEEALKQCRESR